MVEPQLEPDSAEPYIGSTVSAMEHFLCSYLKDVTFKLKRKPLPVLVPSRPLPFTVLVDNRRLSLVGLNVPISQGHSVSSVAGRASQSLMAVLVITSMAEDFYADSKDVFQSWVFAKLQDLGYADHYAYDVRLVMDEGRSWLHAVLAKNKPLWEKKRSAAYARYVEVRNAIETALGRPLFEVQPNGVVDREARFTGTAAIDESAWVLWSFQRPISYRLPGNARITVRIPDTGNLEVFGLKAYSRDFETLTLPALLKRL